MARQVRSPKSPKRGRRLQRSDVQQMIVETTQAYTQLKKTKAAVRGFTRYARGDEKMQLDADMLKQQLK